MVAIMAHAIIILAIILGFGWACVVSRMFRIVVGILVLAGVGWFMVESDKAEKQKVADKTATQAREAKREAHQTELWSRVSPSEVELRNPLLSPQSYGSEFNLTGTVKNLSSQQLGAFEIDVTALDCPPREKCEVIGHSSEVVWADVPPQQVRGISSKVSLLNMPQLRGKLSSTFIVKRVYAGDLLDQYQK
jgi:hypothetical protein